MTMWKEWLRLKVNRKNEWWSEKNEGQKDGLKRPEKGSKKKERVR